MCVITCKHSCFKSVSNNFSIWSLWTSDSAVYTHWFCSVVCFFVCLIFGYLLDNVFAGVHCKITCFSYRSGCIFRAQVFLKHLKIFFIQLISLISVKKLIDHSFSFHDIISLQNWVIDHCCDKKQVMHKNQRGPGSEGGRTSRLIPEWEVVQDSTSAQLWRQNLIKSFELNS